MRCLLTVGLNYAALLPRRGRILRRTLSVRLSVRPSRYRCHRSRLFGPASITSRHLANYNDTHTCTFRHALRAAYRTVISAAQILVIQ